MTLDERGRWFRVYARSVRQHPKFRNMNLVELGAWLALRAEAELRDSAKFIDREEAALVLRRRGGTKCLAVVDQMIAGGLFDRLDDGGVTVHDRADHDRPKYPSDDPEKVKGRVKKHRESKGNDEGNEPVTTRNESETIAHARAPVSGAGADSDSLSEAAVASARETPEGWDAPDAIVAYHDVTGRYPSEKVIDWLNRMSDDHPEEAIAQVMAEEYSADNNLGTLLSRTDNALKLDAHRRAKADERARAKAQAMAEAPHRKKEREATPEEKEQASLQRQAIRIGFQMGIPVPTDPAEVRKFVMKHGSAA